MSFHSHYERKIIVVRQYSPLSCQGAQYFCCESGRNRFIRNLTPSYGQNSAVQCKHEHFTISAQLLTVGVTLSDDVSELEKKIIKIKNPDWRGDCPIKIRSVCSASLHGVKY